MSLLCLPNELLPLIVEASIPEDFECLLITCKKLNAICHKFVKRHHELRQNYNSFGISPLWPEIDDSLRIPSSWALLRIIAAEPIAGRYIQHLSLQNDASYYYFRKANNTETQLPHTDVLGRELVERICAGSADLEAANLSWNEYFGKLLDPYEQLGERARHSPYSQPTAVLLLTLLPNLRTLVLPGKWRLDDLSQALLLSIIKRAQDPRLTNAYPSLAQLTTVIAPKIGSRVQKYLYSDIAPLLTLPAVHIFHAHTLTDDYDTHPISYQFTPTLRTAYLTGCRLTSSGLRTFLKSAIGLKSLILTENRDDRRSAAWDLSDSAAAIVDETGNRLEELSIALTYKYRPYRHRPDWIDPNTPRQKVSLRGMTSLRRLELGLETVFRAALYLTQGHRISEKRVLALRDLLTDLVPASVRGLALVNKPYDYEDEDEPPEEHAMVLEAMFEGFGGKVGRLTRLTDVYLHCPSSAKQGYRDACEVVREEVEKAGVWFHLRRVSRFEGLWWGDSYEHT